MHWCWRVCRCQLPRTEKAWHFFVTHRNARNTFSLFVSSKDFFMSSFSWCRAISIKQQNIRPQSTEISFGAAKKWWSHCVLGAHAALFDLWKNSILIQKLMPKLTREKMHTNNTSTATGLTPRPLKIPSALRLFLHLSFVQSTVTRMQKMTSSIFLCWIYHLRITQNKHNEKGSRCTIDSKCVDQTTLKKNVQPPQPWHAARLAHLIRKRLLPALPISI